MLKYLNTQVTLREIPDEIVLCINITGCDIHCPGCHSKHLWNDIGEPLTMDSLDTLITPYKTGITCVCFMGGDNDPKEINKLGAHIQTEGLKSAWYSGRTKLPIEICAQNFNYIKLGPYIEELGPLDKPTTNQRLYKVEDKGLVDITNKFWNGQIDDANVWSYSYN